MRIGVISDIHIDRNKDYPVTAVLAKKAQEKSLAFLFIAGDISNQYSITIDFMKRITELTGIPVYFVPGNHDMWDQENAYHDSRRIYQQYQEHPACLINKRLFLGNDWAVVGDIGWYDYSFGNEKYPKEDFEKKRMYDRTWQDSVYIHWHQTDAQVHQDMLRRLEKQLMETQGKQQIVITHMVTKGLFTVPEEREMWRYFNAFLGSKDYSDLFERYHVKYSVMGHVHFRKRHVENGTTYICSCLNYHTEWKSRDCESEIEEALTVIDLK